MTEEDPSRDKGVAHWDARYAAAEAGLFGEDENLWLRQCVDRLQAEGATLTSALSLADGDGRNGAFLAERGFSTTGLDLSPVATRRAEARDAASGVRVKRIAADLMDWEAAEKVDLCALISLQGPESLRRRALSVAADALAPGGRLVMEGFAPPPGDAPPARPGPLRADMRWSLPQTLGWVPDLEVDEALEGWTRLDEGRKHRGLARVMRLLLRRPG